MWLRLSGRAVALRLFVGGWRFGSDELEGWDKYGRWSPCGLGTLIGAVGLIRGACGCIAGILSRPWRDMGASCPPIEGGTPSGQPPGRRRYPWQNHPLKYSHTREKTPCGGLRFFQQTKEAISQTTFRKSGTPLDDPRTRIAAFDRGGPVKPRDRYGGSVHLIQSMEGEKSSSAKQH